MGRQQRLAARTEGRKVMSRSDCRELASSADITCMSKTTRKFKFDRGDWIAVRDHRGEWCLAGKVVDADSESCTVETRSGLRNQFLPGVDPIARVRWTGRGRWALA
jgi:hypothetical protein